MKGKRRRKNLCRNCFGKMKRYHFFCPFCGRSAGKSKIFGLCAGLFLLVASLYLAVFFAN
jgi:predicted amidophosphoribosyltransferase